MTHQPYKKSKILSKEDILLEKINNFYIGNNKIDVMIPIINGESIISLRLLDWFVTTYCKDKKVKYDVYNSYGNKIEFDVCLDYKAQLKAYNKRFFDPFCRRNRIKFKYNESHVIITTVGQLNFFSWAIKNNIIKYVEENIEEIENKMKKDKIDKNKKLEIKKLSNETKNKLIDQSTEDSLMNTYSPSNYTSENSSSKENNKIILTFDN